MFKPNTDFYSYVTNKEENRYQKLEWKAQFKKIDDIVEVNRNKRKEDKLKRRDKSSDHHLIHNDLIKTLHYRASDDELKDLTEITFLEKIGLTNQKKR